MNRPVREFKAHKPKGEYKKSNEGTLHDKDGNTIHDDSHMHRDSGVEVLPTHPNLKKK